MYFWSRGREVFIRSRCCHSGRRDQRVQEARVQCRFSAATFPLDNNLEHAKRNSKEDVSRLASRDGGTAWADCQLALPLMMVAIADSSGGEQARVPTGELSSPAVCVSLCIDQDSILRSDLRSDLRSV